MQVPAQQQPIQELELASSRIARQVRTSGFTSLSRKEKMQLSALVIERLFEGYLILCQSLLTAGIPISNKFSQDYVAENVVTDGKWAYSAAPLFFIASAASNFFFSLGVFGSMEEKYEQLSKIVNKRGCNLAGNLLLQAATYYLAYQAAHFDSDNARQGLKEWGVSGATSDILTWSSHLVMTVLYQAGLDWSSKDIKTFKDGFKSNNLCYTIPAFAFAIGRTAQLAYKMFSTNSVISAFSASTAFLGLIARSQANIRSTIMNLPCINRGQDRDFAELEEGNADQAVIVQDSAGKIAAKAIFNSFIIGTLMLNAIGNAALAKPDKVAENYEAALSLVGQTAYAICSFAICGSNVLPKLPSLRPRATAANRQQAPIERP